MARKDRTGNRKPRNTRSGQRVPEMGYYHIVTDTKETERCYFTGLRDSLPVNLKQKLIIKVVETATKNLIQKCVEMVSYEPQYRIPWIVFDRDQVVDFDSIIENAEKDGINVEWSNPCFEIWMFSYFGKMPSIQNSWTCCSRFGEIYKNKTHLSYSKADDDIYKNLLKYGDELKAIRIAEQKYKHCKDSGQVKASEMCPCTTVHELVREIRDKVRNE